MPAETPEPLDSHLRDIALPAELSARLRKIADQPPEWADDDIDFELNAVDVPAGLQQRVQAQLADLEVEEQLDASIDLQLRDVEMSRSALARLRVMPQHRPRRKWLQMAVAVSLVFLLTGVHTWAAVQMLYSMRGNGPEYVFVYAGPLHLSGGSQEEAPPVVFSPPVAVVEEQPFVPEFQLSEVELMTDADDIQPGAAGELFVSLRNGMSLQADVLLLRYGLLTSPYYESDSAPPLEQVILPQPGGMEPPMVRGFDRNFLIRTGVQPIVRPGVHKQLREIQPPLSTTTRTFDQAVAAVAANRPVRTRDIRVEDFIAAAAQNYPSKQPVSLHMDGGAAPLRPGAAVLQVTAQAGQVAHRAAPATHLVVAIDVSASMRWDGRLEMAKRAVLELMPRLGPQDRLSVIAFNAEVMQIFELARQGDGYRVQPLISRLRPFGGANLAGAVQKASLLAINAADDPGAGASDTQLNARVALITDSRDDLPDSVAVPLVSLLSEAARGGFRLTAIDLGDSATPATTLEEIAQATGSGVRRVSSERELRWALLETLTGGQSIVAADTRIKVQFNPAVVAGYRVLGHEATTLGGLMPGESALDLRALDTAPVLVEVWFRRTAQGQPVQGQAATAVLEYREPATGKMKKVRSSIRTSRFATSFTQTSPQLQATALAAHAAETLRGSPFTRPRDLRRVIDLTDKVDPQLQRSAAFQSFSQQLKQFAK